MSAATDAAGLGSAEAADRLRRFGPNAIPERRARPAGVFVRKLSGPVPWMLEAALALEAILDKRVEAAMIVVLLLLNAGVSYSHERRAQGALDLLRARLRVLARVRRDGAWAQMPADGLVPGDLVHVRMGDFVPADVHLLSGAVLLDRSALTGESAPVEAKAGDAAPSGAIVRRGEATGEVTATGARTAYGRTVSLVEQARSRSHLEGLVLTMVKSFVAMDGVLAAVVLGAALSRGESAVEVVPFVLMLLIASVPVALPAMFTLATAVGSAELARRDVLVTRLAALEEVAALDVLCSDKTGTLTKNELTLVDIAAAAGHSDDEVVGLAAIASDSATQDPIDLAILEAAKRRPPLDIERIGLVPFDPATKRAEARARRGGVEWRVVKGALSAASALAPGGDALGPAAADMAKRGCRVLAVAAGPDGELRVVGLVGLSDPPRDDSKAVVARLAELGVRVVMVTGDAAATASAVAADVGIGARVATKADADTSTFDVLAGVLPEDKFRLVRSLQSAGHVVGMTGDGVNDAPALQQADVGIAVASAVDVAKSSASLVLTRPGLSGVLDAVEIGRRIHQRLLTYALNMSVKKLEIPVFLAIGYLALGAWVVTPRLLLLVVLANDLSTMTLAADRARAAARPERWNGRTLVLWAFGISLPWLAVLVATFVVASRVLGRATAACQTLAFLAIVFIGQANVYLVRERRNLWRSRPGTWTLVASALIVTAATTCAVFGVLVDRVQASDALALLASVAGVTLVLDAVKARAFEVLSRDGRGPRAHLATGATRQT